MPNFSVCNKITNKNSHNFGQKNTSLHTPLFPASTISLVDKSQEPEPKKAVTFEKTGFSDSDNNQNCRISLVRKTSFNSKQATPVLKRHDSFTKVINQAPMHPPSRQNRVIVELIRKLQNENKLNEGKLSQVGGSTNVRTTIERFRKSEQLKLDQLKMEKIEKMEESEKVDLEIIKFENDTNETINITPNSSKTSGFSENTCSQKSDVAKSDVTKSEVEQKTFKTQKTEYESHTDEPPETIFDTICCATSKLSNLSSITTISFNEMDILSDDSLSTDDEEFVDSLILNSPKIPRKVVLKEVLKDPGKLSDFSGTSSRVIFSTEVSSTEISSIEISGTLSSKNNPFSETSSIQSGLTFFD